MSLFFNFPDSLLKLTSETTRLKGRAFDLQETAFAERRKCSWKSKGKVLKEAGGRVQCVNYRWKREQRQPRSRATWGSKWGHWAGRGVRSGRRHDLGRGRWVGAWDEGTWRVGPQGVEGSQCLETVKPSPSPLPGGFLGTGPSPADLLL